MIDPTSGRTIRAGILNARVLIVLLVLLLTTGPSLSLPAPAAAMSLRQDTAEEQAPPLLAERWAVPEGLPELPDVSAEAVFVGDIETGQVLFARDADAQRAPASTAKVAVAVTLVDILTDLDQVVTIQDSDTVDITVFSNAQLAVDDEVTVEGLLYGLMLPSGNDAARALARVAGQTLDPESDDPTATFLDAVNARVAELGATNTVILNPAGEDTEGQHSSARDLAILTAALLDNETLATIVDTEVYGMVVGGPSARTVNLSNTNPLLAEAGIIGVKTGSTEAAGACLITGAVFSGSSRVVIVVLGSELVYNDAGQVAQDERTQDTLDVIRAIPESYQWIDLTAPGVVEGLTEELAAWQVTLGSGSEIVIPAGDTADLTYRLVLGPSGEPQEVVGSVLFFLGDEQIAEQPVYQL
ncbi:MAG TPA: serine hydrolase [Thermomicrobiales bacterium]|jgi:D-alanyl-D-alanine carboxypeptidase (penicillin-binding protein 5/6)|nr:serine hydrolase [Thermomicrobiales bacterium]